MRGWYNLAASFHQSLFIISWLCQWFKNAFSSIHPTMLNVNQLYVSFVLQFVSSAFINLFLLWSYFYVTFGIVRWKWKKNRGPGQRSMPRADRNIGRFSLGHKSVRLWVKGKLSKISSPSYWHSGYEACVCSTWVLMEDRRQTNASLTHASCLLFEHRTASFELD